MDKTLNANSFSIGSAKSKEEPANESSPVEDKVEANNTHLDNVTKESEEELNAEYIDNRSITITPVKNYSLYRKVNDKSLPRRKDFIGSSVYSSRTLSANKGEIEAYFPNLIGLAPNNPDFVTRVKQYLNNIQIGVDELGRKFDISFHYYHKRDYYKIKNAEEAIETRFKTIDRSNTGLLRKAANERVARINELESTKYQYGYPVNIEDYLMYRHCLLYRDIAKDTALINGDTNVRFYFKDDAKEEERVKRHRIEINKAKVNYVTCVGDPELFEAVYIQYCLHTGRPVTSVFVETQIDKELNLDRFSTDNPAYFNNICANKDVRLAAKIEKLIARGELVRYKDNQNITTTDGTFIGSNSKEAISWFKNPNNATLVEMYFKKLEKY